jgi:hypothetical protein
MARQKGCVKTGGRKKGSLNKKTSDLLFVLEKANLNVPERIIELLPTVSPEIQIDILMKLMCFLYPKRKPSEAESQDSDNSKTEKQVVVINIPLFHSVKSNGHY